MGIFTIRHLRVGGHRRAPDLVETPKIQTVTTLRAISIQGQHRLKESAYHGDAAMSCRSSVAHLLISHLVEMDTEALQQSVAQARLITRGALEPSRGTHNGGWELHKGTPNSQRDPHYSH